MTAYIVIYRFKPNGRWVIAKIPPCKWDEANAYARDEKQFHPDVCEARALPVEVVFPS